MSDLSSDLEETILHFTDPNVHNATVAFNATRSISHGLKPLDVDDPRNVEPPKHHCDGCGATEGSASKLSRCGACRVVHYCSVQCQKAHWKKHKKVCSRMTQEIEARGRQIINDLQNQDISSFRILQTDDAVFAVAKKYGLYSIMEQLFRLEASGTGNITDGSVSQELITSTFKGNRTMDGFTCACPIRSREFVLSSPTAWEALMDAILHIATSLTKFGLSDDKCQIAFTQRAARDVFASINLVLVHKTVAEAIFFGNERSPSEARRFALETLAPKLKLIFQNGGDGFAPEEIDFNMTVQANIFQFTAMLSYWYIKLVDSKTPHSFIDLIGLDTHQERMFETFARPMGEGAIALGRNATIEESRSLLLNANRLFEQRARKHEKEGGKKSKKNRW